MLSGHPAFSDRTAAEVFERRSDTTPPPLAVRLGQSVALNRLLTRSLSLDPDRRPATAAEFARELEGLLIEDPTAPPRRDLPTGPVLVFCIVLTIVLFVVTYLRFTA
jgi:eukaryotic-like serine/threonine-protein kinase